MPSCCSATNSVALRILNSIPATHASRWRESTPPAHRRRLFIAPLTGFIPITGHGLTGAFIDAQSVLVIVTKYANCMGTAITELDFDDGEALNGHAHGYRHANSNDFRGGATTPL